MPSESESLRRHLREVGFTAAAIRAVWPDWWSSDAESSPSAVAELRYTVARGLGLAPSSLFEGPPRFVWTDQAKFKGLTAVSEQEQSALTSFAVALAKVLLEATPEVTGDIRHVTARQIRLAIQERHGIVRLDDMLAVSWGMGIPVVHLGVFPLNAKRMHAVTAAVKGRYTILLARSPRYPSQDAFTVAHELGHICSGHLSDIGALLESADPARSAPVDDEELTADRFALEVLTGDPDIEVEASQQRFSATALAMAARSEGIERRIDPAILALCLGYTSGKWRQAMGALKLLEDGGIDVPSFVNRVALAYLDLTRISDEQQSYLRAVVGIGR